MDLSDAVSCPAGWIGENVFRDIILQPLYQVALFCMRIGINRPLFFVQILEIPRGEINQHLLDEFHCLFLRFCFDGVL